MGHICKLELSQFTLIDIYNFCLYVAYACYHAVMLAFLTIIYYYVAIFTIVGSYLLIIPNLPLIGNIYPYLYFSPYIYNYLHI